MLIHVPGKRSYTRMPVWNDWNVFCVLRTYCSIKQSLPALNIYDILKLSVIICDIMTIYCSLIIIDYPLRKVLGFTTIF